MQVPETHLYEFAGRKSGEKDLQQKIAALGKSLGAPWGRDQKDATVAALLALKSK